MQKKTTVDNDGEQLGVWSSKSVQLYYIVWGTDSGRTQSYEAEGSSPVLLRLFPGESLLEPSPAGKNSIVVRDSEKNYSLVYKNHLCRLRPTIIS